MTDYYYESLETNPDARRLVKIVDGVDGYRWKDGKWIPCSNELTWHIRNDITDFVEISEEEANVYIKLMEKKKTG